MTYHKKENFNFSRITSVTGNAVISFIKYHKIFVQICNGNARNIIQTCLTVLNFDIFTLMKVGIKG